MNKPQIIIYPHAEKYKDQITGRHWTWNPPTGDEKFSLKCVFLLLMTKKLSWKEIRREWRSTGQISIKNRFRSKVYICILSLKKLSTSKFRYKWVSCRFKYIQILNKSVEDWKIRGKKCQQEFVLPNGQSVKGD